MDETINEQKSNILVDFLKAWLYVFLCAFKGLVFLLYDLWFNILFRSIKKKNPNQNNKNLSEEALEEAFYERTKKHKKKEKVYNYSPKVLAKYEKMKAALADDLRGAGATRSKEAKIYRFTARDMNNGGKIITDTMAGFSKLDINSFLVNGGYEVYKIETNAWINMAYKESSVGGTISIKDLIFLMTQISTYLKAGITLNESIRILTAQLKNKKRQHKVLKSIGYELNLGQSFSYALSKQGNYFPALLINMIKAAEASGTLQETLEEMADYYTEVNSTRKEMISALTYPAIIVFFALGVVTFIIIWVVPQFTQIYADSGTEINGFTKFIIDLSDFLQEYIFLIIGVIVALMLSVYFLYAKVKSFRASMQIFLMHMPVIKNVIIYKEINIFAKTFASLLRNNVFITESMGILSKITTNEVYKAILFKTINNILKGEKISDAFADHWAVPDVAYYMIVTGESTGQLADMMQKVSDYYQNEHKTVVSALKSLIEPVMIVFLAVIVGGIILAVIVPMFSMFDSVM